MDIRRILDKCVETAPTEEEAYFLLKAGQMPEQLMQICIVASRVRDDNIGRVLRIDGEISPVLPCAIKPSYRCCDTNREALTTEELLEAVRIVEEANIIDVRLCGGASTSDGTNIVELIRFLQGKIKCKIHVNIRSSYSKENLQALRQLGVTEIAAAFETMNEKVFVKAKPHDHLKNHLDTAYAIDEAGLNMQGIIMVGLGSTEKDYVRHLFFLKKLHHMNHLAISRFNPYKGMPMQFRHRASPQEAARLCALARLVLRTPDISLAAGSGPDDIPLWLMAGGNRITTLSIHKGGKSGMENSLHVQKKYHNTLEIIDSYKTCKIFAEEAAFRIYPHYA